MVGTSTDQTKAPVMAGIGADGRSATRATKIPGAAIAGADVTRETIGPYTPVVTISDPEVGGSRLEVRGARLGDRAPRYQWG